MAQAAERAALLVKNPTAIEPSKLDTLRTRLTPQLELTDSPEVRRVLEQPDDAERRVTEALARARQALRKFDLETARAALSAARESISELAPTRSARALAVEVAVREAEVTLVASKSADLSQPFGVALAIDPTLSLDRDLFSPPLVAQLSSIRAARDRAPRITLEVDTTPPGARVFAAGQEHCCTPLYLKLGAGWQVLWAQRDGYQPNLLRLSASSNGPVSMALTAQPAANRLKPLVEAVRALEPADEASAARALLAELHVEVLVVVEQGAEPRQYRAAPPAAVTAPVPQVEQPPAGPQRHRWPSLVAGIAGLGLGAGGGVFGAMAQAQAQRAAAEHFGSDGAQLHADAARTATTANVLYGLAAACAAAAIAFWFIF
ncbi:MAG: hypothetical protein IPJ65_28785 [Archangiaceae bacterium]|nr:hypothetical protein [Archangiaceae bacterium]